MSRYRVSSRATIGISCIVEADSAADAKGKALSEVPVASLCVHCRASFHSDTLDEWTPTEGLDGTPDDNNVEVTELEGE